MLGGFQFTIIVSMVISACGDAGPTPEPDGAPPFVAPGQLAYPADRSYSPLTAALGEEWRTTMSANDLFHFNVLGDEYSASQHFLRCLSEGPLGKNAAAFTNAIAHFERGPRSNPFVVRNELVASGFGVEDFVGELSPLTAVFSAETPSFIVVQVGAHDIGDLPTDEYVFAVEQLLIEIEALPALPVLTALFPRNDDAALAEQTALANRFLRAVAQKHQIPFIAMPSLKNASHFGEDQIAPVPYTSAEGSSLACDFSDEALDFGHNARNFSTATTLDRLYRLTQQNETIEEGPSAEFITGSGTSDDPHILPRVGSVVAGDTTTSMSSQLDNYPGCLAPQDESGPEIFYQIEVENSGTLFAHIVDADGVDVDVHILSDLNTGDACLARGHKFAAAEVTPGTYYIVVDTFVGATALPGAFYLATYMQ